MLGGYNIFGTGAYATKNYNNLPPHFRVRIWFRFYKIDSWDSENLLVSVNNVQKFSSDAFISSDSMYTGSQCGQSWQEESTMLALEFNQDSVLSLDVKLHSGIDGGPTDESWGFSHFAISVLKCDHTCKTCSNENANGCLTCYQYATKQTDNTCLCDDTYYAVTQSSCQISICTVCTSCYTGCRKCTGSGISDCQSCISGEFLFNKILPERH